MSHTWILSWYGSQQYKSSLWISPNCTSIWVTYSSFQCCGDTPRRAQCGRMEHLADNNKVAWGHIASFEGGWGEAQALKKFLQALTRKSVREKLLEVITGGIRSVVEAEGMMLSLELGWLEGDDGGDGSSLSSQRAWQGKQPVKGWGGHLIF